MAATINQHPLGDTPHIIEDKVRALPANQGLNEYDMWVKIDAEVAQSSSDGKLKAVERYDANGKNKHGAK
jgi:hypothetical protein